MSIVLKVVVSFYPFFKSKLNCSPWKGVLLT